MGVDRAPRTLSRPGESPSRSATFARLWAGAHLWHLLGNPDLAGARPAVALVAAVGWVLLRPRSGAALAALAMAQLVTVWDEAPMLGNHWLLVGFVDAALLVALAVAGLGHRRASWAIEAWLSAARWCLLAFYGFAAFAKLNAGFFDPAVSCAPLFLRSSTDSLGLGGLGLGDPGLTAWASIYATAAVELAVPVALVVRRTRPWGVLGALVFHGVLSLDRSHQFFDFSSALTALFVLFVPEAGFADLETWVRRGLGRVDRRTLRALALVGWAAAVGAGVAVASDRVDRDEAFELGWWSWQVVLAGTVVAVAAWTWATSRGRSPVADRHLGLAHPALAVVVAAVVFNGFTPYLELKTGFGWNMYANLRTVDGDSNHFLVRATLPLSDEQADLVEVVATDDPGLDGYRLRGRALTWRALRTYLADHRDVALTYRRAGSVVAVERAGDHPELVDSPPEWRDKLQLFRAVDLHPPEDCLPTFGPAR